MSLQQNGSNLTWSLSENQEVKLKINGENVLDRTVPENFAGNITVQINVSRTR